MKFATALVAASALALSACATTGRITTDFDQSQSFGEYQTFAWAGDRPLSVLGARLVPPAVQAEVANAIRADLENKGYRYTENVSEADFAVSFTIGTRDGVDVIEMPDFFWQDRVNWRWGGRYFPPIPTVPVTRSSVREYTEGTLAIDIYDVSRRSPVWHGAGQRNLTRSELRGETNTAATDAQAILSGFPPN